MAEGRFTIPTPENESVRQYGPGSADRANLREVLARLGEQQIDIPVVIGGRNYTTGRLGECRCPHDHAKVLGRYHKANAGLVNRAIEAAAAVKPVWAAMPWHERAAIFLRAADMLAGSWRMTLNAATMLSQSKNSFQAEIDAACELIDFWRFNAKFMEDIYGQQPISSKGVWNRLEQRPLEGFVFAVTPFNFTSIAGNLPTAPAMMGNTVVWKPASSAVYSGYFIMRLLSEAGLPEGVINFVPGSGAEIGDPVLAHSDLAGIHFTGSTKVFQGMWKTIGENITRYRSYPRIVGETGGKDFVVAHSSADPEALAVALARGAFEYQGQKCSAASRAYIPSSLWPQVRRRLLQILSEMKMGDVKDFENFINAVIDANAFRTIAGYIDHAARDPSCEIIAGGKYDDSRGYFIEPTVIVATDPWSKTMVEEIFGPVLTIHVFADSRFNETLGVIDSSTSYALTGALFARDRKVIHETGLRLQNAAGNYYVNDKPTGAVVGQQPFGGGRASGTNDKAGSMINLLRWVSPRTIKETFCPPTDWRYPFLDKD